MFFFLFQNKKPLVQIYLGRSEGEEEEQAPPSPSECINQPLVCFRFVIRVNALADACTELELIGVARGAAAIPLVIVARAVVVASVAHAVAHPVGVRA